MTSFSEKHVIILENEKRFADALAVLVLDKPKLSVWMILIPIIFVYYFYRLQKFSNGRTAFAENYMISRKRALNEALAVIQTGKEPDIDKLVKLSSLPEDVRKQNAALLALLVSHYTDLLRSDGDNFESLVQSAYRSRTNYLLFNNQLNQVEKTLNSTLMPHLDGTLEGVNDIVSAIERHSEKLRRDHAEAIFP
jgi:hypothetical protein